MSDNFSIASAARALDGAISRMVHDLVAPAPPPGQEWTAAVGQFRTVRERTIELVRDLTQEQADFSPAANSWSAGQITDHLLLSEKLYRTQCQNLIELAKTGEKTNIELTFQQVNTSVAFIPREVIPLFTLPLKMFNFFVPHAVRETMFRFPLIPALNPRVSDPAPSRPINELRSSLASSIDATEAIFRGDLPAKLKNMTLSHPILGTNNIVQVLGIMGAHEERHQTQIRAVLANPRFPKQAFHQA
jgi:DinB superfamily